MRINSSHPKKYHGAPDKPYLTITMTWEEAQDYVDEYEDVMKMFEDGTVHSKQYHGMKKELSHE